MIEYAGLALGVAALLLAAFALNEVDEVKLKMAGKWDAKKAEQSFDVKIVLVVVAYILGLVYSVIVGWTVADRFFRHMAMTAFFTILGGMAVLFTVLLSYGIFRMHKKLQSELAKMQTETAAF